MQICKNIQQFANNANMQICKIYKKCKYTKLGAYSLGAYSLGAYSLGAYSLGAYSLGAYSLGAYSSWTTDFGSGEALTILKRIYRTL